MSQQQAKSDAIVRREVKHASVLAGVVCVFVQCKSGIRWNVQAGCLACKHPGTEGICVPILSPEYVTKPYCEFPCGDRWDIWSGYASLTDAGQQAEFRVAAELWIARIAELAREPLSLDETRLRGAMEAWLPVIIGTMAEAEEDFSPLHAFQGYRGWLHWPNCD